jgi:trans-aconitate methyltransferase
VFSNATLHWVQLPEQVLAGVYQSLVQGGRFIAEFGGKGNVQAIIDGIIHCIQEAGVDYDIGQFPWYYPSIGEYTTLMEEVGFRVTLAQHYDRPTPLDGENGLRDWIVMFGNAFFTGVAEHERNNILTKIDQQLRPLLYSNGQWIADYKRIRVIGIKE